VSLKVKTNKRSTIKNELSLNKSTVHVAQELEYLPSIFKSQGSIQRTTKNSKWKFRKIKKQNHRLPVITHLPSWHTALWHPEFQPEFQAHYPPMPFKRETTLIIFLYA
jgi:hypothetical protein